MGRRARKAADNEARRVAGLDPTPKKRRTNIIGTVLGAVLAVVTAGASLPIQLAAKAALAAAQAARERSKGKQLIRREQSAEKIYVARNSEVGMSIWSDLAGAAVRGYTTSAQNRMARRSASMPGAGAAFGPVVGAVGGGLARIGTGLGFGGMVRGAGTVAGKAVSWCRRNPGRCAALGGLTAIEGILSSGGSLPRSGRSRGITSRELRSFRRVTRIISKYCAPVRKAMKSPALKKGR